MAVEATSQIEQSFSSFNRNDRNQSRLNLLQQEVLACNELLAQNPDNTAIYLKRAELHHKLRQYSLALDDYSRALEIEPEPAAYIGRATVYNALHQSQNALSEAAKALELNPHYAPAFIERGKAYKEQHLYAAALADQERAIELDPKNSYAYTQRGDVWLKFERFDKASSDYKKAIALDPDDYSPYVSRAVVALRQSRYAEALANCQRAINLNPNAASAYNNRGLVYLQRKDYNRALTYLDYAAWLDPTNATVHLNRGMAYLRLKQYHVALSLFNYVISLDPIYALAYNARGMALLRLDQYQQATADFAYAAELAQQYEPKASKIVTHFAKITPVSWPLIILALTVYFVVGLLIVLNHDALTTLLQPLTAATHGLLSESLLTGLVKLMLVIGLLVGVCNLSFKEIGWQKKNVPMALLLTAGLWMLSQISFAVIDWLSTGQVLFNSAMGNADLLTLLGNWLGFFVTDGLVLQTMLFGFFTPQFYFKVEAEKPLSLATFVTTLFYVGAITFSNYESHNYAFSFLLWWLILLTVFNLWLNFNNLFLSSLASAVLFVPIYLFVGNGFEWLPPLLFLAASFVWPTLNQRINGQIYVD